MDTTDLLLLILIGITLMGFLDVERRLGRLLDIAEWIKAGGSDKLL